MNITTGTIFVSLWGYDQTNVNFYEVIAVGKSSLTVRPIDAKRDEKAREMVGTALPVPGAYSGEPMRRKLHDAGYGPSLRIKAYEWAKVWEGKPEHFSSYA